MGARPGGGATAARLAIGVLVPLLAATLGAAPVTLARFTRASTASGAFTTGSILPPANLAGTGGASVTLTWTASTSTGATGYQVLRSATSGSGYAQVGTVTPISATTTTDGPANGTWYYVLRSYLQSWTSSVSNEASVAVGGTTTGFKPCTSNLADTGGNGNGYETSPANGCVTDGSLATDANTGTNTVNACANAGKDRHRFWGFALGVPASVTSVDGISARVDLGTSNNGGIAVVCLELSWDGGTTWTAAKSVTLTSNLITTYTLGGVTDTWGRTWTGAQLSTTNLRVRVTDVSTQTNKDFRLDGLSIQVAYTP